MAHFNTGRAAAALFTVVAAAGATASSGRTDGLHPTPAADRAASAAVRLTLDDLTALVDHHPLLAASRHTHSAALAAVDAAGAAPNPELEATFAYGRARETPDDRFEWGLALSIPLDWIARRGGRMAAARAGATLAEAEAAVLRREVVETLHTLFFAVVEAEERVAVLEEMYRQATALRDTVTRRVDMGEVRPVEAVRIAVEADKIGGDLSSAEETVKGRRARFARWLGGAGGRTVVAVADLAKLPSPMTAAEAAAAVRRAHPMVIAETARLRSLEAEVEVARRERTPSLSARVFTDHELDRRAYGGGVSIALPLWNWNTAEIDRAERLLAAGETQLTATRFALEGEAIEAQTACRAAVARAAHYRDKVLPNAVSAAETVARTYALGEAPLLDVIDARRTLVETKGALLDALVEAHTDCNRLFVLVGKE